MMVSFKLGRVLDICVLILLALQFVRGEVNPESADSGNASVSQQEPDANVSSIDAGPNSTEITTSSSTNLSSTDAGPNSTKITTSSSTNLSSTDAGPNSTEITTTSSSTNLSSTDAGPNSTEITTTSSSTNLSSTDAGPNSTVTNADVGNTTTINPNCFSIPKFGTCPAKDIAQSGTKCISGSDCPGNELCCQSDTAKYCTAPLTKKAGDCPDPKTMIGFSGSSCYLDENCGGKRKCCKVTNCNYQCTDVPQPTFTTIAGFTPSTNPTCMSIPKFGSCPVNPINPGESCVSHDNCIGNKLCCPGTSGKQCSDPDSKKIGDCPPPYNLFNPGAGYCYTDDNCGVGRKCCMETPCAYRCSDLIMPSPIPTNAIPPTSSSCISIPKFGQCPTNAPLVGSLTACTNSAVCTGNEICCNGKCVQPHSTKRGSCPNPNQLINQGLSPCYVDSNCGGGRRCCKFTACEYRCSDVST